MLVRGLCGLRPSFVLCGAFVCLVWFLFFKYKEGWVFYMCVFLSCSFCWERIVYSCLAESAVIWAIWVWPLAHLPSFEKMTGKSLGQICTCWRNTIGTRVVEATQKECWIAILSYLYSKTFVVVPCCNECPPGSTSINYNHLLVANSSRNMPIPPASNTFPHIPIFLNVLGIW